MNYWYTVILILILLNTFNVLWVYKHHNYSITLKDYNLIYHLPQDENIENKMQLAHNVDDVFRMYNCGLTETPDKRNLIAFCRLTNFVMCADIYKSLFSDYKSTTVVNILDKKTLKPTKEWKFVDTLKPQGQGFSVGIEDNRPFWHNGELYTLGTLPNGVFLTKDFHCRMVLTKWHYPTFVKEFERVLPSPENQKCEKNWGPISYEGNLYFILSTNPMKVIEYNVEEDKFGKIYETHNPNFPKGLRGGKVIGPYSLSHNIGIAHERINDFYYFYIFLFENKPPFRTSKISQRIKFPKAGGYYFQYPNHAFSDENEVILSFGLDDCGVCLTKFSHETIRNLIE